MADGQQETGRWLRLATVLRAVVVGILIALVPANVWLVFLFFLHMPAAALAEAIFLAGYLWWTSGGGPPRLLAAVRAESFRRSTLSGAQWRWGLAAALFFAVTVHGAIVLLFRLVPFPAAAFHAGYDFSFIPTPALRWIAVLVAAASAGICEETGFRGYLQQPLEVRFGPAAAIAVSSLFFMLLHLNKDWSGIGMVPIVFGAGVLLGALAWASRSLVFCMIGHTAMDVGLFAYWWGQIAGTFTQRPVGETGIDVSFGVEVAIFAGALCVTLTSIRRLRGLSSDGAPRVA